MKQMAFKINKQSQTFNLDLNIGFIESQVSPQMVNDLVNGL